MAYFEINWSEQNKFWLRYKSDNGKIVWWTEGYTSKENAKAAIAHIKKYASDAKIKDLT